MKCLLLSLTVIPIITCSAQQKGIDDPLEGTTDGDLISVAIIGYNYTNRYIDSYSVDGEGGGNIFVSSSTSGGGKSACCVLVFTPATSPLKIKVRWQSGACMYTSKSRISGSVFENVHSFYKEVEVTVPPAPGVKINRLEVHFYPDGGVQAELTDVISPPRLVLSEERRDKSSYARCKHDRKPE